MRPSGSPRVLGDLQGLAQLLSLGPGLSVDFDIQRLLAA